MIEFKVGDNHIEKGKERDAHACPIALCLKSSKDLHCLAWSPVTEVTVQSQATYIRFEDEEGNERDEKWVNSKGVVRFIRAFDLPSDRLDYKCPDPITLTPLRKVYFCGGDRYEYRVFVTESELDGYLERTSEDGIKVFEVVRGEE